MTTTSSKPLHDEAKEIAGSLGEVSRRLTPFCSGGVNEDDELKARVELARLALTMKAPQVMIEALGTRARVIAGR